MSICSAPWEYDVLPFRITDDIWYVGNKDVGAHIINSGDGLILIDTAYPQTAYLLLESIRLCGFDPSDIKYILHTHAHYDHIGATRMLVEKYGCKTFLGADDAFFLTERPELTWHAEFCEPFREFFMPDVLLHDGDRVCLGHVEIECIASPGHTPGNMTFVWNTHWNGAEYSCALSGGWGLNTSSSEYMQKYGLTGWRDSVAYTLKRLESFSPDIVLGAHPVFIDAFTKASGMNADTNPFIDSGQWKRMLTAGKLCLAELIANDATKA